jgi:hypothetical protein
MSQINLDEDRAVEHGAAMHTVSVLARKLREAEARNADLIVALRCAADELAACAEVISDAAAQTLARNWAAKARRAAEGA